MLRWKTELVHALFCKQVEARQEARAHYVTLCVRLSLSKLHFCHEEGQTDTILQYGSLLLMLRSVLFCSRWTVDIAELGIYRYRGEQVVK